MHGDVWVLLRSGLFVSVLATLAIPSCCWCCFLERRLRVASRIYAVEDTRLASLLSSGPPCECTQVFVVRLICCTRAWLLTVIGTSPCDSGRRPKGLTPQNTVGSGFATSEMHGAMTSPDTAAQHVDADVPLVTTGAPQGVQGDASDAA